MISESNGIRVCDECPLGLVRSTSFGRKRVALAYNNGSYYRDDNGFPSKRHCFQDSEKSPIESLPQDLLVRVLCSVDHDDIKRLFFVSKAIKQAAIVAEQLHFAYSTPKKKTMGFQNFDIFGEFDEIEAPFAPKLSRVPRSRLTEKKLADISIALFSSDEI